MQLNDGILQAEFNIGLALGGGAVKGLAHIGLLKLIDKHGLTPSHISGTSMGAIIGALYAAGLSGLEIETRVREHLIGSSESPANIYKTGNKLVRWAKIFRYEKGPGGLVTADGLFTHLFSELKGIDFNDLKHTFTCSATNFTSGNEVVLNRGKVLQAVQASMAVPGVFAPIYVNIDDVERCLVDGGLVNNVPTSHIQQCNFKIASDVISLSKNEHPKTLEAINGAVNIMVHQATKMALAEYPVDIVHTVDTNGIEAFDFHRMDEALALGDKAASKLEPLLIESLNKAVS